MPGCSEMDASTHIENRFNLKAEFKKDEWISITPKWQAVNSPFNPKHQSKFLISDPYLKRKNVFHVVRPFFYQLGYSNNKKTHIMFW